MTEQQPQIIYNQISNYIIIYDVKISCVLLGAEDLLGMIMKGTACTSSIQMFCSVADLWPLVPMVLRRHEARWLLEALALGGNVPASCFRFRDEQGQARYPGRLCVQSPNVICSLYFLKNY